ncbi:ABC transporter substrate-binding protein [Mesorhizobium sp. B2-3-11]|uniref:branched-chain amino acid ABC transporter substrate-binding protein n=1 Tax=Mesorhizobium sp. B2-3-11 TaxID=2589953 RepID=UPI001127764F|nr:branched-chain amino acid ABC transporter substrate-binding protein [Mesorhizobium sp. B2-3-11]TPL97201.1 ABC transporter substrate-binding protein [Mesorhizobium sp. B2-3-11]
MTDTPLKIGVGVPLGGMGETLGREMANAIQLAVDGANEAGGINGHRIEAVVLDDKGREEDGERVVKEFVRNAAAVAAIGHYNSNVTLHVAPLYAAAGLPLIGPIVSNPALTHSGWSNVYRFTNSDDATGLAIAQYMVRQLGKKTVVVIQTDTVYGRSMSKEFAAAFEAAGGSVLRRHTVQEGERNFADLVASLPREASAIFYGGTFEGAPLVKEMRTRQDDRLFATGDGCWDVGNFLEPAGAAAEQGEGVLVLSACPQLGEIAGSLEMADRYERRFGRIRNYAVNAFDAAATLIDAIRVASNNGDPTRDRVADALRGVHRQGIAYEQKISWDANGDNRAAVTALHRIESGRFRQVAVVKKEGNQDEPED